MMSERMEDDWTVARADSATGASGSGRGAGASDAESDTPADPAEIRAEIRETRERLGDTLEELGERLNPRHVKAQITEQVKENVREATIGRVQHMAHNAADRVQDTRDTIMDTIRENPIPAAMAAIGLGWLFVNARRQADERLSAGYGYGSSRSTGRSGYGASAYGEYPGYPYGSGASGIADQRYASSGEQGGGVIDGARERASQVGHQVQDVASNVADRAQEAASQVAQKTRYQARRVEDRFYESPLAVGAATLALGLATGLAIPASDREVALMGDARDRLVDRAKEMAQETTEKVQHVAERVIDETKSVGAQAARDEGLAR
jgi:gas vesicle protein